MMSRRKAIRNIFNGTLAAGSGAAVWGTLASNSASTELILRPPGALEEKDFLKACIRCGKCVEACPYDTLKLANSADGKSPGSPYFIPREIPCYMCTNYPCTEVCPSGALDLNKLKDKNNEISINNSEMGVAVIHKESCIAYEGIQCDACYRACPLMNEAITLEIETNTYTNKHANLKPVVNSDKCTGCGVCEHSCVVEKAAIFVLPSKHAKGVLGDHYIKSWKNENRNNSKGNDLNSDDKDIEGAIEYLNDDSGLFE